MGREIKGRKYQREPKGNFHMCFKHGGRLYRWSLGTAKDLAAERLFQQQMTLVKAAIIDGTFYAKYDHDKATQERAVVRGGQLELNGLWQCYCGCCTRPDSGDSTLKQYEYQVNEFVDWMSKTHPEAKYVADVSQEMAGQFLKHLSTKLKLKANTFNKYLDTMTRTFDIVEKEKGVATEKPWKDIPRKKWNKRNKLEARREAFTIEESRKVITKATGWLKTLFVLGFYTGQRLIDCCLMTWKQVDVNAGVINVVPHKTKCSSGLMVELPIQDDLKQHLVTLQAAKGKSPYILPEVAAWYKRDKSSLSCKIQAFLVECGFQIHKEGTGENGVRAVPQYGFHSCRHTFVTLARRVPIPDPIIKSIVGDSYPLYDHLDFASKKTAMDKMPSLMDGVTSAIGVAASGAVSSKTDSELEKLIEAAANELKNRQKAAAA